ncbi:MAG: MiaB/RimO family radical SAM methylthiotransferase, partial [Clostridiales bacterium]|nr:MiaB/RimO family radical SAM methylthiotransferase [Clostridiales bacterium]
DIVSAVRGERPAVFPPPEANDDNLPRKLLTPKSWAYLKIADGCDNRCAFCAIPDIRGRFRSRPEEEILREARLLSKQGVREVIIIAQDVTRYGLDIYGRRRLAPLLRKLSEVEGFLWIRLHYLYPDSFTEELIDEIARNKKILKYLDIPIQHINDGILKRMNRRGTGSDIRALLKTLRERIPGVVLRTSLIAGLPGEGEAEFEELIEFLQGAKIERAGVFAYSPEEGTPAAGVERADTVTTERRAGLVQMLQSRIMDGFNDSRIGETELVLVEGVLNGRLFGRSAAESPDIDGVVLIESDTENITGIVTPGDFCTVKITGSDGGDVVSELLGAYNESCK